MKHETQTPHNWSDVIGPVAHLGDVPESAKNKNGLIVLETSDGKVVCPHFQFDKDEQGNLSLNPDIAAAWSMICSLQVDQLGESTWTNVGRFTQSRPEHDDRSWATVLKDPESDDRIKLEIFTAIVGDAAYAAAWLGVELTDPRKTLPE